MAQRAKERVKFLCQFELIQNPTFFRLWTLKRGKPLDKATAMKEIRERLINGKAKTLAKNAAQDATREKEF
ncbi:MAG: hypothetical protein MZV70_58030 [Desulfobacterales bacterium]|nr:hypothetical protein [Desulfobacterales bacterium]